MTCRSSAAPAAGQIVRAEISGPRAIHVFHSEADEELSAGHIDLLTANGTNLPIARLDPEGPGRTLLVPGRDLDINAVHYVKDIVSGETLRVRFDGWFRNLESDAPLGAVVDIDADRTRFSLFAPRATGVKLYLYDGSDDAPEAARTVADLSRDADGVWSATLPGNLHGMYYDYTVHGSDGPGNQFFGTHPVHISDPYARVNAGSQGKSRVWHEAPVLVPLAGGVPAMKDAVAYEVHVQDFTDRLPEHTRLTGPFRAMATPGLTNARGQAIGFDHLKAVGINVVHLMPVQEFLHHPDTEWRAVFGDDRQLQRLGVADENYQWGYRTTHAFAIENRFGDRSGEPGNERDAFRALVNAFHAEGIAVIVDIVPNHTGENMDGQERLLNFNVIDKAYYYRTGDQVEHIGPFGNEVKTEDRPMVRRWIIDQCLALINDFGVDGFRIDLAGQIDEQTLIALRQAVGPDILIYGEPWIDVSDPYVRANPDWDWYKEDAPITFFQDDARNAFKGSPFELSDKRQDRGYAGGNSGLRADVMRAIANTYKEEADSPNRGINYLDIHDNWALADRFASTEWNGLKGVDEDRYRIAAGLLLTSLGPVVIHGGAEIMRSKGLAPLEEWDVDTPFGAIHFKGRDDTYNLRAPNQFLWDTVGAGGGDATSGFAAMQAWWEGLIKFRLSAQGEVFRTAGPVPPDYVRWILPDDPALLGYVVDETVLVLVNIGEAPAMIQVPDLPAGSWRPIADGVRAKPEGLGASVSTETLEQVNLPGASLMVWARER